MKKFKAVLSIVLILAMSLVLFACGDSQQEVKGVPIPEDVDIQGNVEGEETLPKTIAEAVERINAAGYNNEVLNSEYEVPDNGMVGMVVYYDETSTNYIEARLFEDSTSAVGGYLRRNTQKTDGRDEVLELHGCWVIVALPDAITAFVG